MEILVALPDKKYYIWQMLVQINNLMKYGFNNKIIYVIGRYNNALSREMLKIINTKNIGCRFYVYDDTRVGMKYPSTLRLHILTKFFEEHPEMERRMFFYTDPDVIFTGKIDFLKYYEDNLWYVSDTRSYVDSKYIKSKSIELFHEMCGIVDIDPIVVENNDNNVGGAQHVIKNVKTEFWHKNLLDSEKLYNHMSDTSNIYSPNNPIQKWTADMWSFLWNAWKFGYKTKIDDELSFSWATSNISEWSKNKIFHNAGVFNDSGEFFNKIKYQHSPFKQELVASKTNCSYNYINEIKETEIKYPELIF